MCSEESLETDCHFPGQKCKVFRFKCCILTLSNKNYSMAIIVIEPETKANKAKLIEAIEMLKGVKSVEIANDQFYF